MTAATLESSTFIHVCICRCYMNRFLCVLLMLPLQLECHMNCLSPCSMLFTNILLSRITTLLQFHSYNIEKQVSEYAWLCFLQSEYWLFKKTHQLLDRPQLLYSWLLYHIWLTVRQFFLTLVCCCFVCYLEPGFLSLLSFIWTWLRPLVS